MSNDTLPEITIRRDPLKEMLQACRGAFATAGIFSFFVNALILAMPIYMFSLFDRVLGGGGNKVTLAFLATFMIGALFIQALIDIARTYLFVRVSAWIDLQIGNKLLAVSMRLATRRGAAKEANLISRLERLRDFLAGEQIYMLMDLPWLPLFLAFMFFLNFWIGVTATAIAAILLVLALSNKWYTDPVKNAGMDAMQHSFATATRTLRNADVVEAMGMAPQMTRRWQRDNEVALDRMQVFGRRIGLMMSLGKTMQLASMMAVMTVCAILIIDPDSGLSRGSMMASVILVGRVLQPVQAIVTGWPMMVESIENYRIIAQTLRDSASVTETELEVRSAPTGQIQVCNLLFHPPATKQPVLTGINFSLQPGQSLGIVGPTGSGKSTLARLLVGLDRPTKGHVLLDDQEISEWPADDVGQYIGYMPQEVELFPGTVLQNIIRLDDDWNSDAVLDAAQLANVDTMIKHMPKGYQTFVGSGGTLLSGGQMQRVGLARALYGNTKVVILDEPNANLDVHGEQALATAIEELKKRGVTVILILHRPNILKVLDYIMVLADGKIQKMGARQDMLALVGGPRAATQPDDRALNVISNEQNS